MVGGYTKNHRGRSLREKQAVLITADQLADGRPGNIRLQHIENFRADTLKFALKEMVSEEAMNRTDKNLSYQKLRKEMNIKPIKSGYGKGLEELHNQIMQFKN